MKIKTKSKPRRDEGEDNGSRRQPEEDTEEKENMENKEIDNGEQEEHDTSGYIDVGEVYYDEDYRQEITTTEQGREESKTQGENKNETENNKEERCKQEKMEDRKTDKKTNLGGKENREGKRVSFVDGVVEKQVDRDLKSFLTIDSKHDVWKQIKGTKAEIRKLEREIKEEKRKHEGRSL